jgi:hypothetical protein
MTALRSQSDDNPIKLPETVAYFTILLTTKGSLSESRVMRDQITRLSYS